MRHRRIFSGLSVALLPLVTACAGAFEPQAVISAIRGETVVSNTASLSHTFIRSKNSTVFICSQPSPDAAFSQDADVDISIALVNTGKDQGDEDEGSQETEMSGRTPAVLLTRELFFRLCEFSRNYNLSKEEATALFKDTMTIVAKGWGIEAGNTKVSIDSRKSSNVNESLTNALPSRKSGSSSSDSSSAGDSSSSSSDGGSSSSDNSSSAASKN